MPMSHVILFVLAVVTTLCVPPAEGHSVARTDLGTPKPAGAGSSDSSITQTHLAGGTLAEYPFFQYVQAVNPDTPVLVAIDPTRFPEIIGVTADIYIVLARSEAEWTTDPSLVDVRPNGPQTVTFQESTIQDNTFVVADAGELESQAPIGLGVGYDVVVDIHQDGTLSSGDYIDGFGEEPGFHAVPDTVQTGPLDVTVIEYSGGEWLGQRTFFPTDLALMEQLPLVVVGHGWTHQHTFYDHIGFHLASYGYIVMAFTNDVGSGGAAATETASTTTLTNTDYLIANQGTIGGGVLNGHLDSHKIVWIGHSTGGEAVVRAHTRLRTGDFVPEQYDVNDIVLVSSIAPVSFHPRTVVTPYDVNYHMFIGGADTDTTGQPTPGYYQSMAIYERGFGNRQLIYVHGAGHNDFHDGDQPSWAEGPDLIGRAATHTVVKGYYLPLVELYTRGNPAGRDFFTRMYEGFHPMGIPSNVIIANEYRDAESRGNFIIDDYETQPDTGISSSGGAVTFDVLNASEVLMRDQDGSFDWTDSQPANGMTRYTFSEDDPRCVVFDWLPPFPRFYELEVIPAERDFSDNEFVSFRACQGTRHPETEALDAPLTFTVSLRDGNGITSSIHIGNYGCITRTYKRTGFGSGAGWGNEFSTVQIRLSDFRTNGSGLDLSNIVAVRFDFGGTFGSPRGRIGLDDIEITVPAPPVSGMLSIHLPNGVPGVIIEGVATDIDVEISAADETYIPGSGMLHYRYDGGVFMTSSLLPMGGDLFQATLPAATCGDLPEYYFSAEGTISGVVTDPPEAPEAGYSTPVGVEMTVLGEALDANPGWSTEGEWAFGEPTGQGGGSYGYPDPASGATGMNVYGVNLNGDYSLEVGGPYCLLLGPIDLTDIVDVRLRFQRWLNTDAQPWVSATVDVSNNGSNWVSVWANGGDVIEEDSWSLHEYDISSVADNQSAVYVRWGYQVEASAWPFSGWNVDDIEIGGLQPCGAMIPAVSQWGVVGMSLLVLTAGAVVLLRRRRQATAL